jgi:hypothetical protein
MYYFRGGSKFQPMKTTLLPVIAGFVLFLCLDAIAQVSVNSDGSLPHSSAMLDIKSTTRGLLIPRLTMTEMNSVSSPAAGLMIFNTTSSNFYFYTGTGWGKIVGSDDGDWTISGSNIYSALSGNVGIGNTNPVQKVDISGDVDISYPGTGSGLTVSGTTTAALATITNAGDGTGFSAGTTNGSAGSGTSGVYGYNFGTGAGIYGKSYKSTGYGIKGENSSCGNSGYIAGQNYGVYGLNSNSNYGYLGGASYGASGYYSNGNYGVMGTPTYGIYGYLATTNEGHYAIQGSGVQSSSAVGSGYAYSNTLGGVRGYTYWGNPYTFGVAGYSYVDYARSGGTFGSCVAGLYWGCLGYKNSGGTIYGGYFTSSTIGSGKSSLPRINSGIAAWGDLFGADIHGDVYGAFVEGGDYGLFSNGIIVRNNLDIHLQENDKGDNIVLYTNVTTDATVQTCGYATLSGGQCIVAFDPSFADAVSSAAPVIVTLTPMGNTSGVYLSEVDSKGFTAMENNNGKSSAMVSYIAVGKRKGYENPSLPQEVIARDYVQKVNRGLHNDNNTKTNGEGLYYENGKLTVGIHPSTLPDPNKPAVDPNVPPAPEKPVKQTSSPARDGKAPEKSGK